MKRVEAVLEAREPRKSDWRRGPRRQRRRRKAERLIRVSALVFARWARRRGLSLTQAAERLAIDASTLGGWRHRWTENQLEPQSRGRPVDTLERDQIWDLLAIFGLMGPQVGLPTLRSLRPDIARSALVEMQRRCRAIYLRRKAWVVHMLRWARAGAVWAIDFTDPPGMIEGLYETLLVVRDLASGYVLCAMPTLGERTTAVVGVLESLFRCQGRPLVLKSDNGSAFVAEEVKQLLERHGVHALYSPEGTPRYNGAIEAGIGSIKVRAFWRAVMNDHPGEWTCDDVEAAVRQANETGRPRGVGFPTPQEAWLARLPLTDSERARFEEFRARFAAEEYTQRGLLPMAHLQHREQASIDRIALSRALMDQGFLFIRRRRITPPVSVFRQRKIS
jgi:transposase InsO family protein